jgi:FkbM family methyltransferase
VITAHFFAMKLTTLNSSKLRWLFSHEACRKHPLRTCYRLVRWELLRLGNSQLKYRYDDAFDITLLPNEGVSRLTYYFDVSEPDLFRVYNALLKPGMVVLDVGANIGLHTLYFCKRVKSKGKVFAFEPTKNTFERLVTHIKDNDVHNVEAFNCALGATIGRAEVVENPGDTSRAFVRDIGLDSTALCGVELLTLDAFVEAQKIQRIDFLKIDAEGFEGEILAGATEILARKTVRVMQIELDQQSAGQTGSGGATIIPALLANGYVLAKWNAAINRFERASVKGFNSFFVLEQDISN